MSQEMIVCKPTFSAPVVYVQPVYEELKRMFLGNVDPRFSFMRVVPTKTYKMYAPWPVGGDCEVTFEYLRMGYVATTGEVLVRMALSNLRPAFFEELICFAMKYEEEPSRCPIVALGSEQYRCFPGDSTGVPCLWTPDIRGGTRYLQLAKHGGWQTNYEFLAAHR
jgi:hypothetical protein